MPTPHKHAALIKAWADGALIQYQTPAGMWLDTRQPQWHVDFEYRAKPEPKIPGQVLFEVIVGNSWHLASTPNRCTWEATAQKFLKQLKDQNAN